MVDKICVSSNSGFCRQTKRQHGCKIQIQKTDMKTVHENSDTTMKKIQQWKRWHKHTDVATFRLNRPWRWLCENWGRGVEGEGGSSTTGSGQYNKILTLNLAILFHISLEQGAGQFNFNIYIILHNCSLTIIWSHQGKTIVLHNTLR